MHEIARDSDKVKLPSDRSFGFVFTAFFAIVCLLPLIAGHMPAWWAGAVAAAFLLVSLVRPQLLRPLNWLWFKFGLLLHKVMSPLIMFLIFAVSVVPTALIRRLFVSDPLHIRFDKSAKTYWIRREPPGPAPETFSDQF